MKLQKVNMPLKEAIENFGKADTLNPFVDAHVHQFDDKALGEKQKNTTYNGAEYLPETNTDVLATMPITYTDNVKRTAAWRAKANQALAEKTKAALEMSGADIEKDRYSHMSKDDAKFNHPKYEHDEPVKIKEGKTAKKTGRPIKESIDDATLVYDGNGWKIYRANTWEDAKELGSGTKISISQDDGRKYFNNFKADGVQGFYFIIPNAMGDTWCYLYYGEDYDDLEDDTCLFLDTEDYGHTVEDLGYGDIDQIPEAVIQQLPGMQNYEAATVYEIGGDEEEDEPDMEKVEQGSELTYDGDGFKVYKITNYDASRYYGKGTAWGFAGNKDEDEEEDEGGDEALNGYRDFAALINDGVTPYYIDGDNETWCYLYYGKSYKDVDDQDQIFIDADGYGTDKYGVDDGEVGWIPEAVIKSLPGMEDYVDPESLDEGYKKIDRKFIGLDEYQPSKKAASAWNKIVESKKLKEMNHLVESLYDGGVTRSQLDNLLEKDSGFVFEELNIGRRKTHRKAGKV